MERLCAYVRAATNNPTIQTSAPCMYEHRCFSCTCTLVSSFPSLPTLLFRLSLSLLKLLPRLRTATIHHLQFGIRHGRTPEHGGEIQVATHGADSHLQSAGT